MRLSKIAELVAGPIIIAVLALIGWGTQNTWKAWLLPTKNARQEAVREEPDDPERLKLSAQAKKNLRLVIKEIHREAYWRKIYLPGVVVDRPGHSDRGIPAPIAGVITQVLATPGKTVKPNDELFRLKIASESFQTSQMDLYKYKRELEIVQREYKRLKEFSGTGAVPPTRLLDLSYQQDRFAALIHAHQQDLKTRQLTAEQIDNIQQGKFVTEIVVRMPDRWGKGHDHGGTEPPAPEGATAYEVQELKVNLGDHVQAGQILAYLADHRKLYIEGKALKQEAKLLTDAAQHGWPVDAEFTEGDDHTPGERLTNLTVEFLSYTMDPAGLTLPVYIPFDNPQTEYVRKGKTYRGGQYRPGQKVLLKVAVARLDNVFVLPLAAVVREGGDAFVFRQNGSSLDRIPVHVLTEDAEVVVIADDGQIVPGNYLAHNAAAALNRALKANQPTEGGGEHHH